MSDTQTPRKDKRTPVTLKIKFKSATLEAFIERYSVDVSHGGIFIRTKDPLAVGTQMRFEFQLQDASPLIAGEGTVVWTREFDPTRAGVAPGMGVRFDKLGSDSQTVLDKILARKTRDSAEQRDGFAARGQPAKPAAPVAPSAGAVAASVGAAGRPAPAPTPAPARPAPAPTKPVAAAAAKSKPAVGAAAGAAKPPGAAARTMMGMPAVGKLAPPRAGFPEENSKDFTPLPKPMPFHGLDEEVSEDVFDQPTRVGVLDSLLMVEVEHARAASQAPEPAEAGVESVDLPVTPPAEAQLPTASVRRAATAPVAPRPAPTPEPDAEAEEIEQVTSVSVRPSLSTVAGVAPVVAPVAAMAEPEPVAATPAPAPAPVVAKPEPAPVPPVKVAAPKPAPVKPEPVKPKPVVEERPGTTTTPKARPRPVLAEEPAKGRSSMVWPAVGALAFVGAAAAVYFLVIRKPEDETAVTPDKAAALGEQPAPPAPPAAAPPAPVAAVAPPTSQPAVEIVAPPAAAAHAPAPAGIDVDVTSVPAGATVEVEGVAQAATPTRLAGLDGSKPVHLVFHADCYKEEKMTITPKAGVGVTARLRPMDRMVHVSSTPSDAAIFVDGISEGRTPLNVALRGKLDPGQPHKFTFKKGGYDDSEVLLAPDVPCTMEKGVAAVTVAQVLSQSAHVAAPRPTPSRPAAAPSHPHEKPAAVAPPSEGGIQVIDQSKPAEPAVAPTPEPPAAAPVAAPAKAAEPAAKAAEPAAKPAEPAAKPAEPAPTPSQPKETGAGDVPKPTPTPAPAAAPLPAAPKAAPTPTPAAPTAPAKPAEPAKPKPDCDPSPDAPAWARCPSL